MADHAAANLESDWTENCASAGLVHNGMNFVSGVLQEQRPLSAARLILDCIDMLRFASVSMVVGELPCDFPGEPQPLRDDVGAKRNAEETGGALGDGLLQ